MKRLALCTETRFLFVVATLYLAAVGGTAPAFAAWPPDDKHGLLRHLIRVNDEYIRGAMERQSMDAGNVYKGAMFDADSVVSPIGTAQYIQALVCAYVSRESAFYRSEEILVRMEQAAAALVNLQHDDGTIDLLTTNFHSTPDLGFTIFPLALSYTITMKHSHLRYGTFRDRLKHYLLKAGNALAVGGIHTPNHRWVVSAALSWLHSFFPDPRYKARIDQWLAEKIDIDPDGQYHERSTAVYTPITNRSLIDIARNMNYDHVLDAVRRNLDLTFYFVHANGEIATESSRRQDKYLQRNMAGYYFAYNFLALRDKDARYSGMVEYIRNTVPEDHLHYMLPQFVADPGLMEPLPDPTPIPIRYHKHFSYSDMVRIRDGDVDMSVISHNPTFFTFFKGEAALEGVRLSTAFFGKGQFLGEHLEKQGDTYVLTSTLEGPYYQPLPPDKIPAGTDAWTEVPRTERMQSEVQTLRTKILITPRRGKATIRVVVDGPKNLPVTLELGFRSAGGFENVYPKAGIGNAFFPGAGAYVTYRKGDDVIRVGPGIVAHKWTQLRGALPKLQADCVYLTAYAPCDFELTIE